MEKKGMPFEDDIPRITEEVLHAITHLGAPTQHEIAAHLDRAVSTANQQVKLLMEVGKIIQLEGPRPYRYQLAGQSKPKQEEAVPMPIVSKTEPLATPCNNEVKPEKPPKTESPVTPVNGLPKEIKLPTVGKNRELFEAIYAEAEEQDRPLSNQIIRLLKIAMKEMGK
ncbi:MAG: helix-turn-helix domain-containing protein [Candidatus Micrarchaeia archaeon]